MQSDNLFPHFLGNDYISSNLGVAPLEDLLFSASKRYVRKMYGDKNCTSVNTLRNKLSWKHYRVKER